MWSNHEYHICVSKFLSHFQKHQKGYLVITFGYDSRDIVQGEKQLNKNIIQIQGRELGVHVNHFKF